MLKLHARLWLRRFLPSGLQPSSCGKASTAISHWDDARFRTHVKTYWPLQSTVADIASCAAHISVKQYIGRMNPLEQITSTPFETDRPVTWRKKGYWFYHIDSLRVLIPTCLRLPPPRLQYNMLKPQPILARQTERIFWALGTVEEKIQDVASSISMG